MAGLRIDVAAPGRPAGGRPRGLGWLVITLAVVVLSACSLPPFVPFDPRGSRLPDEPARSTPLPADQLVLEVSGGPGGLAPQVVYAVSSPSLAIYGDGRVLVLDPVPDGRDPRRSYRTAMVDPALVAGLAERARGAGLAEELDFGQPEVLDAGSMIVRVHGTGPPITHHAYAFDSGDRELGQPFRARRKRLRALIAAGHALVGDAPRSPYVPDRIFVYEQHARDGGTALPWPGPDPDTFLTGPRSFRGLRCGELRGAHARAVYRASTQNPTHHWKLGQQVRRLLINPLPGSRPSCA